MMRYKLMFYLLTFFTYYQYGNTEFPTLTQKTIGLHMKLSSTMLSELFLSGLSIGKVVHQYPSVFYFN